MDIIWFVIFDTSSISPERTGREKALFDFAVGGSSNHSRGDNDQI